MKRRVTRVGWRILATSGKGDRKSTRLNSSHSQISYAVFCLKKKKTKHAFALGHYPISAHLDCTDAPNPSQFHPISRRDEPIRAVIFTPTSRLPPFARIDQFE